MGKQTLHGSFADAIIEKAKGHLMSKAANPPPKPVPKSTLAKPLIGFGNLIDWDLNPTWETMYARAFSYDPPPRKSNAVEPVVSVSEPVESVFAMRRRQAEEQLAKACSNSSSTVDSNRELFSDVPRNLRFKDNDSVDAFVLKAKYRLIRIGWHRCG